MNETLTLFELNRLIRLALYEAFPDTAWVVAEISELKVNRSGHCYITLVEKDQDSDHIIAQSRAIIWSSTFRLLKPYFENSTGQALTSGIKILARAAVEYHEQYGLSLNIKDIEPGFTMGELEKQKQEIINRLIDEGNLEMNKELPLPWCPQRLAVISSKTAAGWGDFMDQLSNNPYGYRFSLTLFPAIMQGKDAEKSILTAFETIYENELAFDAVVLIRGGGAQADLLCFNTYNLAAHIAQFPIPVLTGIGHERDETVADLVAHTRLKTPTAVAVFLIDKLASFEQTLHEKAREVAELAEDKLSSEKQRLLRKAASLSREVDGINHRQDMLLSNFTSKTLHLSKTHITAQKNKIKERIANLEHTGQHIFSSSQYSLNRIQTKAAYLIQKNITANNNALNRLSDRLEKHDPEAAFSRGFTITYQHGKRISSINAVDDQKPVETLFVDGILVSMPREKRNLKNDKD
ncbi:MAG: exodeoxyribonuclease VII large subunit [Bacteroidota bacterium]